MKLYMLLCVFPINTATAGMGFYSKIDLGIAKYHFELGAGKDRFAWA